MTVLGVSPDDVASHCTFRDDHKLNFPLLADAGKVVHERYGPWGERVRDGKTTIGVLRTTFLIGKDGKIKKVYEQVTPDGHAMAIIGDIDAMRARGEL